MLSQTQSVASVVLDHSECAEVFARHRIDFCCHGGQSIEAAAQQRDVQLDTLLSELHQAIATRKGAAPGHPVVDPRTLSTPRLLAYIIGRHHEYLRTALPFVQKLATKVARVHGDHNPRLRELSRAVDTLTQTLLAHLDQEEETLFPLLMGKDRDDRAAERQLQDMQEEHLGVAKILDAIRTESQDFSLPEWACNSYRTLFLELGQVERDIFTHVHLENHVLVPRFSSPQAS
jgi:regulator of cell morphogenesis and NO signaling